mgnify:CR=1 FL=1|tara:strand:+ start:234 stop:1574 length:1341 start_codon:yes stop_codon:yes gene_type:complete
MSKSIFGTDGIRGLVNKYPITAETALRIGMAVGLYIKRKEIVAQIIISKDTRSSGCMIESALVSGLTSLGINILLTGPTTTPSVPMLIRALRADFGIMITASHNPYCDNGIKMFDKNGRKLTNEVQRVIENNLLEINFLNILATPDKLGTVLERRDLEGRYIEHVKRSVPVDSSFHGLKIVLDCANGGAYKIAPTVMWELCVDIVKIGCIPNGLNINKNCGSTHPEALCRKVRETNADIGIALDGDADRVVVCDENGELIPGDVLIALITKYLHDSDQLRGKGIVVTKLSNSALIEFSHNLGIKTIMTEVGDKEVFAKMEEHGFNFGGEESGHLIFSDFSQTGDGIVSALQILTMLKSSNKPLSKLKKLIALYPQKRVNIPFVNNSPLGSVQGQINLLAKENPDVRISVRQSGTESVIRVLVEDKDSVRLDLVLNRINQIIHKAMQ